MKNIEKKYLNLLINQNLNTSEVIGNLIHMLYPDHKIEESPIEWQYNLKTIIKSLFYNSNIKT